MGAPESAAEILDSIPCQAVLPAGRPLESIEPGEPLVVAVNRMRWSQIGALPVLSEGRLVGCFAEEDLLRVLAERIEDGASEQGRLSVWGGLLAKTCVADAMTPLERLPVTAPDASLLAALRGTRASDGQHGGYLFLLDEAGKGESLRLASFRDVTRLLIRLYDGDLPAPAIVGRPLPHQALGWMQQLLARSVGSVRVASGLGHEPSRVGLDASVAEAVGAMWTARRGYVVVTDGEGAPLGIFTRRDLLRACASRYADLTALRLSRIMTPRVRTITESETLCGLFKQMALASCRHMPLVDEADRLVAVISMWEAVHLLEGARAA